MMSWLSNSGLRFVLILVAATLFYLSHPGGVLPGFALICLVPLGLAIHHATPVPAMALCYLFGVLCWLGSIPGLAVGLAAYSGLPTSQSWLYVGLLCAYLALPYGVFGYLYGRFQWLQQPEGKVHTAGCLTLLVSWFPSPLPVGPAHSLSTYPLLVQLLDLGGEPLLLFVFILANWMMVHLLLLIQDIRELIKTLGSLFFLSLIVIAYGSYRLHQYHNAERSGIQGRIVKVAVVQPNLSLPRESSEQTAESVDTLLQMSARLLADHPDVDLVVWPETPKSLECSRQSISRRRVGMAASESGIPFMINCMRHAPRGGIYNTALLIVDEHDVSFYDKHKLFPLAETIPWESLFPILRKLAPKAGHYIPGNDINVFTLADGWRAAPSICYEIMFSSHVRKFISQRGEILFNQSNDAWFGHSRIADFMIASAILQSVAYRVPLVRVSNSGNSLVLKASGELLSESRTSNVATAFTATIFIPVQRSPYAKFGNVFLYLLTLVGCANLLRQKALGRRMAT